MVFFLIILQFQCQKRNSWKELARFIYPTEEEIKIFLHNELNLKIIRNTFQMNTKPHVRQA